MSHGHSVYYRENDVGVTADNDVVVVKRFTFGQGSDTIQFSVELCEGRSDGLVHLTAVEALKIAKELRRLAIAAFEAI